MCIVKFLNYKTNLESRHTCLLFHFSNGKSYWWNNLVYVYVFLLLLFFQNHISRIKLLIDILTSLTLSLTSTVEVHQTFQDHSILARNFVFTSYTCNIAWMGFLSHVVYKRIPYPLSSAKPNYKQFYNRGMWTECCRHSRYIMTKLSVCSYCTTDLTNDICSSVSYMTVPFIQTIFDHPLSSMLMKSMSKQYITHDLSLFRSELFGGSYNRKWHFLTQTFTRSMIDFHLV